MLQNAKVTAFSISQLLKENQQPGKGSGVGAGGGLNPATQVRVKTLP